MEKTYTSPAFSTLHITPFRLLSGSGAGPNFNVGSSITEASATTDAAARSFYDDDYDEEE